MFGGYWDFSSRGYGLTKGTFSESGCFEVAHAAYDWLLIEKGVKPANIIPLGYSLGSGVAVELAGFSENLSVAKNSIGLTRSSPSFPVSRTLRSL